MNSKDFNQRIILLFSSVFMGIGILNLFLTQKYELSSIGFMAVLAICFLFQSDLESIPAIRFRSVEKLLNKFKKKHYTNNLIEVDFIAKKRKTG